MDRPTRLITAIGDEDRQLRQLLDRCSPAFRELRGPNGCLSFKETLGHVAFWDSFAVDFFVARFGAGDTGIGEPVNFEKLSRRDLARVRDLPFSEVFEYYEQATATLLDFLHDSWHLLSSRQREDFTVPLKHRRHHRLLLAHSLVAMGVDDAPKKDEAEA